MDLWFYNSEVPSPSGNKADENSSQSDIDMNKSKHGALIPAKKTQKLTMLYGCKENVSLICLNIS